MESTHEQSRVRKVLAALDATGEDGTFTQPGFYKAYTKRTGQKLIFQNARNALLEMIKRHGFFELVREDKPSTSSTWKFYRVTEAGRAFVKDKPDPGPVTHTRTRTQVKHKAPSPQGMATDAGTDTPPFRAKAVWGGSPSTFDYRRPYQLAGVFTDQGKYNVAAGREADAGRTVYVDDVLIHTYQGGQYMLVGDTAWPVVVNALLFDVPKALRAEALKSLRPEQIEALRAVGVDLSSLEKSLQP